MSTRPLAPNPSESNPSRERRVGPRLDVLLSVGLETDLYGSFDCVARNVSAGGMFVQTSDPLPLGTTVRVTFSDGEAEIVATGTVRNHYFVNYAASDGPRSVAGMSVAFDLFEVGQDRLRKMLH